MEKRRGTAGRELVLATIGMGLYWPFFTHPVYIPELYGASSGPSPTAFMLLLLATFCLCAAVHAVVRRSTPTMHARAYRIAMLAFGCASLATATGVVLGSGPWATLCRWMYPLAIGVFLSCTTARWATAVRSIPAYRAPIVLTASLVFSTVASIAVYDIGAALGLSEAASTQVLPLASGLVSCLLPAADGLQPGIPANEGRDVEPGSALRWPVMTASLFVYLLGSGVFRGAFTAGAGYGGVSQDWFHRAMLLVLSLLLVAWAYRNARRAAGEPYPWIAFLIVCTAALYCGVLFYPTLATVANEIMLPTRPIAVFLMWVAAEQLAQHAGRDPVIATACIFLPLETATRIVPSQLDSVFWTQPSGRLILEATMLATALALTVGMVAWIWLSLRRGRATSAERRDGNGAKTALACLRAEFALTEREADVMGLLAQGYTQKRIAEELAISVSSVQTYAKTLYRKLDVHSRQEVIDLVALREQDGGEDRKARRAG